MKNDYIKKPGPIPLAHLKKLLEVSDEAHSNKIEYWQERILKVLLMSTMLLGMIAYVPSVYFAIKENYWLLAVIDTVVYAWMIYLCLSKSLKYRTRVLSIISIAYLLGIYLLYLTGPLGGSTLWLFSFPILTVLFLGIRPAVYALALNAFTYIGTLILIELNITPWSAGLSNAFNIFLIQSGNALALNGLLTFAIGSLVKGFKTAFENEEHIIKTLRENREKVIRTNERLKREMVERRHAEERNRLSQERFKLLFELAPDGLFVCDLRGRFIDGNRAAEKIIGCKKEDLIGKSFIKLKLLPPEQMRQAIRLMAKNKAGKNTGPNEFTLLRMDGSEVYIEVSTVPMKLEGKPVLLGIARDISDRKKAEEALRVSEERLNMALEATSDGLWDWDIRSGQAYFGPRWFTMLGYEPDELPGTYETWANLLHEDDRDKTEETVRQAIDDKSPSFEVEFRMRTRQGDYKWILSRGKVVARDSRGHPIRLVGTHVDITDRKDAETELRHQAAFARNNPAPVIQANFEGKVIRANPAAERLFNFELSDINIDELFPDYRDKSLEEIRSFKEIQVEQDMLPGTFLFTTKWDMITQTFYIYGSNISERKRAERAQTVLLNISEAANSTSSLYKLLKTVHRELGTLIDFRNFYVALYDSEEEVYTFPYCVDDKDGDEYESQPLKGSLTDYVRRLGKPVLINAARHEQLSEEGEVELIGNPSKIWMGVPLKTASEVTGVMVLQDYENPYKFTRTELDLLTFVSGPIAMVIERKRNEENRRKLQEKLEKAERMESLGILAGGVAHDLNNMLGPLVGYPDLILSRLPEDSPVRKQIEKMGRSASEAADVIQDLLTLARRGRYEMHPLDLNSVVDSYTESANFNKLVSENPNVEVNIDLDRECGLINGSEAHLWKVIMNLVVNAFDAMKDGGRLSISTRRRFKNKLISGIINIPEDDYIILRIADTGVGIAPEDIDKIFEPYFSKKKMGTSGSGLGLSVVYGIVKDHKGYYDVFSEIGQGTEFVLYFPVTADAADELDQSEAYLGGEEKVLIVDDSAEQREMVADMLESMGYDIHCVCGGREAIDYLKDSQADIVLLDMIMEKDFDGLRTYEEIIKIHPGQKAIIVSGYSQTEHVLRMQELGAGQYVKKPYTIERLARAVREELDRKPSQVPAN